MSQYRHMADHWADEVAVLRARVAELERAEVERREAETLLRESRTRMRTVVSNAPIVLFALDANGIFTVSDGKALESIGYKPGQAVGQSVFEIYADNPQISEHCRRALAGEAFTTVVKLPTAAYETRYTPMHDAQGNPAGCIGVATDITERLRAEEALRKSEERFRLLAENIPGAIYLCRNDARYTMTYLNDAIESLTGYTKDRFLSQEVSIADLIHADDLPGIYNTVNEAVAKRETFHLIYRLWHASGRMIWAQEHGVGVYVNDKLEYLEGYITDITQRVAAEEALEQSRAELERRVAERTANLLAANDKALRTQEELAHVLRVATVGELASGLAHELNQPLTAITNYIQGTRLRIESQTLTPDQLLTIFDRVAAQAQRAADILRTVRHFITRTSPAGVTKCDLNRVVHDAVTLAELEIKDHGIQVQLSLAQPLPQVEGDPVLIGQVILNLMRNGIEAMATMPADHRVLCITTKLRGEHEVETIIQDTGPGLAPGQVEQLFKPFFTTKPNGLGMGLSISRSIIESHHGGLWVEPGGQGGEDGQPCSGTAFHFTLPVRRKSP